MAVNNPDGSSVTVNQPPAASGGTPPPSGPTWSVEYEVDFTAAGAGKDTNWAVPGASLGTVSLPSIVGANSATWGGYVGGGVWGASSISSWCNPAVGASTPGRFDLTHGTGLSITPTGQLNEWDWYCDSPKAWAALTDLIPGVTEMDTIALQLYSNASQDPLIAPAGSGWQGFGLSVNKNVAHPSGPPFGMCFASAQTVNGGWGGVRPTAVRGQSGQTWGPYANNANVFEILIRPGFGGAEIAIGTWSGSWPDVGTMTDRGFATFNTAEGPDPSSNTQAIDLSAANAQIFSSWGGSTYSNEFTEMTAYKFRALKVV